MMKIIILIFGVALMTYSCKKSNESNHTSDNSITLSVNINDPKQQIHAFGASDAWSAQFVGKSWPQNKKEQIAQWLFSNELDQNNNPLGIGLSGWRFNIGAGSSEQGAGSQINDEWRRAECFLNADGTYDWSKQAGQKWFLNAARNYGVTNLTAFVNSPPVFYTKNGMAWSSGGSSTNLMSDRYDDFASFTTQVLSYFKNTENIEFQYLSPFNEPQWDWDNKGQEGSPYRNAEISNLTKLISKQLIIANLNTKIEISDAAHIEYITEVSDKPERGNQVFEFFNPSSVNYIGDLVNVAQKISGHSYYSTFPVSTLINERQKLKIGIEQTNPDLEFWQTEYCLLEGNEEISGNGRNLGMDPALYLARVIHYDLTIANAASWYWWLSISPYNYKDGLIYIDESKTDGNLYSSKLLWALGNYSRFIKPGMKRYDIIRSDNQTNEMSYGGLMASAYATNNAQTIVVVVINYSQTATYPIKIKSIDNRNPKSIEKYTTSASTTENLKYEKMEQSNDLSQILPRSIVTFVLQY